MSKANQKQATKKELVVLNQKFDEITNTLESIAISIEPLMPLVADSLRFTTKLVRLYKASFNQGLEQ